MKNPTSQQVIDHWTEVRDRLITLENQCHA